MESLRLGQRILNSLSNKGWFFYSLSNKGWEEIVIEFNSMFGCLVKRGGSKNEWGKKVIFPYLVGESEGKKKEMIRFSFPLNPPPFLFPFPFCLKRKVETKRICLIISFHFSLLTKQIENRNVFFFSSLPSSFPHSFSFLLSFFPF